MKPEVASKLKALDERIMNAFKEADPSKGLVEEAEAFLPEDYATLTEAVADLGEDLIRLLRIQYKLSGWHAKGLRCSVCGMTPKQGQAADYDCIYEC